MTTKTITITDEKRLAILKHLATGKKPDVVSLIVGLPASNVLDIGSQHGYPDTEKLAWAAGVVEKKITGAAAIPEKAPDRRPTTIPGAAAAPTPAAAPGSGTPASPTALTKPDEIRVLLNTAKGHPSKRIQAAANRAIDALDRVKTLIQEDQEKHAARRQAEAEKAQARAEVERLERQLAAAKAKLRGKPTPTKPSTTTTPKGEYGCRNDGCEKVYDTPQGRSMHERMKCEHRPAAEAS